MVTYNHKPYIAEAIESILSQKTSFIYKLFIGDDCSKDGTIEICKMYQSKYPEKIEVQFNHENKGPIANALNIYEACIQSGAKYIAMCEGDDYWSNNLKLQKQIDFLEKNQNFSLCCHDVLFQFGAKKMRSFQWDAPGESTLNDLLIKGNYISLVSVVFRNTPPVFDFLKKLNYLTIGDYMLYISVARNGKIKYFKDRMAVYRVHQGGSWSQIGLGNAFNKSLVDISALYDILDQEQKNYLRIQLLNMLEVVLRVNELNVFSDNENLKALIRKMEIPQYILDFIKHSVNEKKKSSYYSKNIPVSLLINGLKEKLKNRIPRV